MRISEKQINESIKKTILEFVQDVEDENEIIKNVHFTDEDLDVEGFDY